MTDGDRAWQQWSFVDLSAYGRSLTKVVLPGVCEMLAIHVLEGGEKVEPGTDEADYLSHAGFREVAPDLFVRPGSYHAEAGLLSAFSEARTVDFDPERHVSDVLPGDGEDRVALTFSVAAKMLVIENEKAIRALGLGKGETLSPEQVERVREMTDGMTKRNEALIELRRRTLAESPGPSGP